MFNWNNAVRHQITHQDGIDTWLDQYIGKNNWTEWLPISSAPLDETRTFSFKYPKHATMFLIKWG